MYRYAVSVAFRFNSYGYKRRANDDLQLQTYIVLAETTDEAETRGTEFADEFCTREGWDGAYILKTSAIQIPDVA